MSELTISLRPDGLIQAARVDPAQAETLDELLAIADSSAKADIIYEGGGTEIRNRMIQDICRLRQRMLPTPASRLSEAHLDWLKRKFMERGWRDNKRSTPSHKLVRIIRLSKKSQRQRCSDLAKIIEHVAEIGISWEGVVEYLKDQGGVEPLLYRLRHPGEEDGEDDGESGTVENDDSTVHDEDVEPGRTADTEEQAAQRQDAESNVNAQANAGRAAESERDVNTQAGANAGSTTESESDDSAETGESGGTTAEAGCNEEVGNDHSVSPHDAVSSSPPASAASELEPAPAPPESVRIRGMENGARYVLIVVAKPDGTGEVRLQRKIDPSSQAALESLLGVNL